MNTPVEIIRGDGPIVLGLPHTGIVVSHDVRDGLNDNGLALADTDWHIDRLYSGLLDSATIVRATFHRYVIDANRDPSGESLYPGQNTTGLCPLTDFDGAPIYKEGAEPSAEEIERRRRQFHAPYHAALAAEITRAHAAHGVAILYDCHSIRSHIPFLFEGALSDFNVGTNNGLTCDPRIEGLVVATCQAEEGYSNVLNGRFKGGWTTRHYGRPAEGQHAVQMELAQSTYMEEAPPWRWDETKAAALREPLRAILTGLDQLARSDAFGTSAMEG